MSSIKTLIDNKVAALKNIFEIPPRSESMAGVIILYVFTNSVATSVWMFNAWSPFIFTLFNGSNVYVGLMSAINGFFELSCALVSGHVADTRWGPSKTLRHAVHFGLVTLCVVLLGVWSGKLWLLILAQCFEGTYMGFSFTCLESVFAQCLRRGERDRLYSVKFSCEAAGPIAGLILSAILYAVVGNSWNVKVLRWVMTAGIALHLGSMVTFLSHFEPLPWQRPLRHTTNSERTSNTHSCEQNNYINSDSNNNGDSNKLHHTHEDNSNVEMFDKDKVYTATDVIVLNSDANGNENNFNTKLVQKHQKEFSKEVVTIAKTEDSDNKNINNSSTTYNLSNCAHHPITREEDANTQTVMTPRWISCTANNNSTIGINANSSYAVEEERVSALNVETGVRVNVNEQEVFPVNMDSDAHVAAADVVLHTAELVNRARAAVWSACGSVVPPALIIAGAHAQSMCTAVERTSEEKAEDEAILRSSFVGVSSSHTINVSDHAAIHESMERENHVKSEYNSHSSFSSASYRHEKATEMTTIPEASSSTVDMQESNLVARENCCSSSYNNNNNNEKLREENQQITNASVLHVEQGEVLQSCNPTSVIEHDKASQSAIDRITSHNTSLGRDHDKHDCEDCNCGHCFSNNNNRSNNNNNTSMDVDVVSATNDVIHSHTGDITREKQSCADHDEVYEIDLELQKARGVRRAIMKCIPLNWYPVIVVVCDLVLVLGSGMTTQYFALFMMKLYDVSPVVLSLLGLANSLLIAFLAILNGFIGQRWGRVRAMLPLKLAGSFILLWMALARGTVYGPKFLMCIAYVVRNAFMNCSSGLSRALLMDLVPENKRGRWNAIESVQSAGWSGTAFLGGFLADSFGYGAAFIFTFFFHITACCMLLPLTARNDARLPVRVDAKKYHEIKASHHIDNATKTDGKMQEVK